MMRWGTVLSSVALLTATVAFAQQAPNVLTNGDFETVTTVEVGEDRLWHGWTLPGAPIVPGGGWSFNTHYVGTMEVRTDGAASGERYVRVTAPEGDSSHVYQMREDLQVGQWYRVSARIRGGPVTMHVYEYYDARQMTAPQIAQATAPADQWIEVSGFYRPEAEDFKNAAPAIAVPPGRTTDIDDVRVEALDLPAGLDAGPDIVLENPLARIVIAGNGGLKSLVDLASGEDYAVGELPVSIFQATRAGMTVPLHSVTREGDVLVAQFLDPAVQARVRVEERDSHFLFEVVGIEPEDVTSLTLDFPVLQRAEIAAAFNATYGDDFGMSLLGTTNNTQNVPTNRGDRGWSLRCRCVADHEIVGAKFAFVAAPFDGFADAIVATERANGLPSPHLDGQWARFSDRAYESYLFATSVVEDDIDTLIDYAKLGGFGTIIILKNSWLANHGHYDINTDSFPDGMASLKAAVDRIHAAGLHAGVHVFGPTISSNDPWITPVPRDELAYVELSPLAEGVDAEAKTITLAAEPEVWPPRTWRSRAMPGNTVRIGDELIDYVAEEVGPPFRLTGCIRGAYGTVAAEHAAGAPVRGMLKQWGFFLVQPDSELADQLTTNFAERVNTLGLDMVYFDASEGAGEPYHDQVYYLNKMHTDYYRKFDHDVLYQTSNGTGTNLSWHIIPRSASADGHGDIKGYLDQRWPGILSQARNWTRSDIGWYYMFKDVRPDQIEYVRAKALGLGASISIEASRASLEALPLARKTFDMLARYERARLAGYPPAEVAEQMLTPGEDFRLFDEDGGEFALYRAVYEEPRRVDVLDGDRNAWTIASEGPSVLGAEIVRGNETVAAAAYDDPNALTLAAFDDPALWLPSDTNQFEQYVRGGQKELTANGPVMAGVTQELAAADEVRLGDGALLWSATDTAPMNGWSGIGKRFEPLLDLTGYSGLGLWINGDGLAEAIRVQLWDAEGRHAEKVLTIDFNGWSLHTFPIAGSAGFDPSRVEYLVLCLNNISRGATVQLTIDDIRAIPDTSGIMNLVNPALVINGTRVELPVTLEPGQAISFDGPVGATFWPVGMVPGEPVNVNAEAFRLRPGENTVTLEADGDFPGDVQVILHHMWPVE